MKWQVKERNWMMQCPKCKSVQLCGEHEPPATPCLYSHIEPQLIVPALPAEGEHERGSNDSKMC